jgi:hypothetical protein
MSLCMLHEWVTILSIPFSVLSQVRDHTKPVANITPSHCLPTLCAVQSVEPWLWALWSSDFEQMEHICSLIISQK